MAYTPPSGTVGASWVGQPADTRRVNYLKGSWYVTTAQELYQPPGIAAPASGVPTPGVRLGQRWIRPVGKSHSAVGAQYVLNDRTANYRPAQFTISASWSGANAYAPSHGNLRVTWDLRRIEILPGGLLATGYGSPILIQSQFIAPTGLDELGIGDHHYTLHDFEYAPPQWTLNGSWVGRDAYTQPVHTLPAAWSLPAESKIVSLTGIDGLTFGALSMRLQFRQIAPSGLYAQDFGTAAVRNGGRVIAPAGFNSQRFGTLYAYNLKQFVAVPGFNAYLSGTAFLLGGVKSLAPNGASSLAFGTITVVNTKANRTLTVTGIASPGFGAVKVSPRMLYPSGMLGTGFGTPVVQKNPHPNGFEATQWGRPSIEYKTKYLRPGGIYQFDAGFPRVFDPSRKVYPPSFTQTAIFGDIHVANVSIVVRVQGFDAQELSPWASLENNRRYVTAPGMLATQFGSTDAHNKTPSLIPPGINSLRISTPVIGFLRRMIYTPGINTLVFGTPKLSKTPEIAPRGFAGDIGVPTIWPRVRTLETAGKDAQLFGFSTIWFRYRFVRPMGLDASTMGAGARLEHGRRTLLGLGMDMARYGTPAIALRNRLIAPASIWENFATGHMVGGLRFLRPAGFEATRWGWRIIPESQTLYPSGFREQWGMPGLRNNTTKVAPPSIYIGNAPTGQWGTALAWNRRQYVAMFYDPDSDLTPPKWPQWTLIENRNKVLRATGQVMSAYGYTVVANKATPLLPAGIAAPGWALGYKAGLVAYRVRPLRLDGLEPPYMSSWARIYNAAPALLAKGFAAQVFGTPAIENTRRSFRFQGFDSAWFGYPMVAYRIRTLTFESRYGIAPPVIRLPEVKLYTRYIEPVGYEAWGSGGHSLTIRFQRLTPRWTAHELYGDPRVWNRTPELLVRGRTNEEWGMPSLRLQWRPLPVGGTLTQIIPKPIIAFRDRSITLAGIKSLVVSDKLTVVKTGAPPYSTQLIDLRGTEDPVFGESVRDDGYGIQPPGGSRDPDRTPQVPLPIINQQVVRVTSDDDMTLWGAPVVTANSIRVEPGLQELTVGEPVVSLKVRVILVDEFPRGQVFEPSKVRVTPHTIWAVVDAPEQAKRNHPESGSLHFVQSMVVFGNTVVMLKHRVVKQNHNADAYAGNMARFGTPSLQNRRAYVLPTGFNAFRSGWHSFPTNLVVEQIQAPDSLVFGGAVVKRPPYVGPILVTGRGWASQAFGTQRAEFHNRHVKPTGLLSEQMGTLRSGDQPYQWQGLRVGPLMPTIPAGFNGELLGTPWVSRRVREVLIQGDDMFRSEYELTEFAKRMRVARAPMQRPSQRITPVGFNSFASNAPNARPQAHYIRPDGNSDQFRKGAF